MEPTIDENIQACIAPLTSFELEQLEENIVANGCRDALVVWQEKNILLDGHNRYAICRKHDIAYNTVAMSFATESDAVAWVLKNQLGRRNLTPEAISYYRGWLYNHKPLLAAELRRHFGVSDVTLARDVYFSTSVDDLSEHHGRELKSEILSGKLRLSKQELIHIAKQDRETQANLFAARNCLEYSYRMKRGFRARKLTMAIAAELDLMLERMPHTNDTAQGRAWLREHIDGFRQTTHKNTGSMSSN